VNILFQDINFLDGRRREKSENRNFEEKREVEERKNQSTKGISIFSF